MKEIEVTAVATGENGGSVSFTYQMPETVSEFVTKLGEDVAAAVLAQQVKIKVQAGARGKIKLGKTPQEIQEWANKYVPGAPPVRKSAAEKLASAVSSMTAEEKKALLEQLKSSFQK